MKEKDSGGGGVTINANMKVLEPSRIAMSNSNQILGMITYRDENGEWKKQLKKCVNWRGRRSQPNGGRAWEGG